LRLALALATGLPALALASALPRELLLVVSKSEHALQLRVPHSFALLGRAPLLGPHGLAFAGGPSAVSIRAPAKLTGRWAPARTSPICCT